MSQKKGFKCHPPGSPLRVQQVSSFKRNGFTLLELLITIFVFTTGVLGVFLISQYPIVNSRLYISRLTASYLAQEGIEIVKNLRDENWLKGSDWRDGLNSGEWKSDYNDLGLSSYDDSFLNLETNGFYGYSFGTSTKFKRKIIIENANDSDGIPFLKVLVLVEWQEKNKSYKIEAQENLYNWWPY